VKQQIQKIKRHAQGKPKSVWRLKDKGLLQKARNNFQ